MGERLGVAAGAELKARVHLTGYFQSQQAPALPAVGEGVPLRRVPGLTVFSGHLLQGFRVVHFNAESGVGEGGGVLTGGGGIRLLGGLIPTTGLFLTAVGGAAGLLGAGLFAGPGLFNGRMRNRLFVVRRLFGVVLVRRLAAGQE